MAASPKRIYVVSSSGTAIALVRARSQSEAIRHCTANMYSAEVADQETLVKHLATMTVEDATSDNAEAEEASLRG